MNRTEWIENGYQTGMERVQNGYRTGTGTRVERRRSVKRSLLGFF